MKKNSLYNKGFTLVETLVGLVIFTAVIAMLATVAPKIMEDTSKTRQKLAAQYLADEGLEYVRNLRDSLIISSADQNEAYNKFTDIVGDCMSSNGNCDFNTFSYSMVTPAMDHPMTYQTQSGYTGRYDHSNGQSIFTRYIVFKQLPDVTANGQIVTPFFVESAVKWNYGNADDKTQVSTVLYFNRPQ